MRDLCYDLFRSSEKIIDLTPFDIAVDENNLMPEEVAMAVYRM